jgi:hypothetical protein
MGEEGVGVIISNRWTIQDESSHLVLPGRVLACCCLLPLAA